MSQAEHITSDNYRVQILRKVEGDVYEADQDRRNRQWNLRTADRETPQVLTQAESPKVPIQVGTFSDGCIRNTQSGSNSPIQHILRDLFRLMVRTLAPLRKIVSRSLDVLSWNRVNPEKPASFILQDELECGHVHPLLGLDIFDLLNAYTDNPGMTARRHRCLPCLRLVSRKPMASVKAAASKAGVA